MLKTPVLPDTKLGFLDGLKPLVKRVVQKSLWRWVKNPVTIIERSANCNNYNNREAFIWE